MQVADTVRHAVRRNGELMARLGHPVTSCPFAAQNDPRERALARIWVSGYMAAAPPPPGDVDLDDAADIEAAWREEDHPRDHRGRFANKTVFQLVGKALEGGFTYSVTTRAQPSAGFSVSPYPDRSVVVPTEDFTSETIDQYKAANRDLLDRPDHFLGAWHEWDDETGVDRIWLDVSIVVQDRAEAETVGRDFDQVAMFDLAEGVEIALGGTGGVEASHAGHRSDDSAGRVPRGAGRVRAGPEVPHAEGRHDAARRRTPDQPPPQRVGHRGQQEELYAGRVAQAGPGDDRRGDRPHWPRPVPGADRRTQRPAVPQGVAAFNPNWRDQPRWPAGTPEIGGQWREQAVGGVPDVGGRRVVGLSSPVSRVTSSLGGGQTATVELVELDNGTRAVRKTMSRGWEPLIGPVEDVLDAEELAVHVADAVGVRVPQVERLAPDTVLMDYVDAQPAAMAGHSPDEWVDTDQGRLLGLLDLLIFNGDRHDLNWMVDGDELVGIDHGLAWETEDPAEPPDSERTKPFQEHFVTTKVQGPFQVEVWADNDMSPQDIDTIRRRLEAVRDEFEQRGAPRWFERTMARLDAIGARATGTRVRVT